MNVSKVTRLDECDGCHQPMTTDHLHDVGNGVWVCFTCLIKKYTTPTPDTQPPKTSCWKGVRPSMNSLITKPLRSATNLTAAMLCKALPNPSPKISE